MADAPTTPATPLPFDVRVRYTIVGDSTYHRDYHLTAEALVISRPTPDRDDDQEATEELARIELGPEASAELQQFMENFPLKRLRKRYDDKYTYDGMQLDFEISRGGDPAKKIMLRNKGQPDLRRLCERINELIKDKGLRVPFPNMSDAPVRRGS